MSDQKENDNNWDQNTIVSNIRGNCALTLFITEKGTEGLFFNHFVVMNRYDEL